VLLTELAALLAPRVAEPAALLTELAALFAPRVAELAALRALSVTEPPELLGVFREPLLFCGVDFRGGIETSSREN
jgi:hypothetical protein